MINQEERPALQSICERIDTHCSEIKKLSDALCDAQSKNPKFSLDQPFNSAKSSMMKTVLANMEKKYWSLRSDLRKVAHVKEENFENMFPKLNMTFETYYTVVIGLLNLIYQMQCMKVYCHRLLGSSSSA
jgi:hypothetical protein